MINKPLIYLLLLLIFTFSCTLKETAESHIDSEIRFLELRQTIDSLDNLAQAYRAGKSMEIADSLTEVSRGYKNELSSFSSTSGLDLARVEERCLSYFGLDRDTLSDQKITYLFLYNAYKICGPGYVACGIPPTVDSEKDHLRYLTRLANANTNYNNYIDSTLNRALRNSFPKVRKNEIIAFDHSCEVVLKKQKIFDESFHDSACVYVKKDTVFMELYKDIISARFKEL